MKIIYASEPYIKSFHSALTVVAREKIYIEMIEPPDFEKVEKFQKELIANNWPGYYAMDGDNVVGWADLFPSSNPRLSHRGNLGMGLLPAYRGQGFGTKLLHSVMDHAKKIGLEKAELTVYTQNEPAIQLYKKLGFLEEGLIKKYRKLDGQYFDALLMGKFL